MSSRVGGGGGESGGDASALTDDALAHSSNHTDGEMAAEPDASLDAELEQWRAARSAAESIRQKQVQRVQRMAKEVIDLRAECDQLRASLDHERELSEQERVQHREALAVASRQVDELTLELANRERETQQQVGELEKQVLERDARIRSLEEAYHAVRADMQQRVAEMNGKRGEVEAERDAIAHQLKEQQEHAALVERDSNEVVRALRDHIAALKSVQAEMQVRNADLEATNQHVERRALLAEAHVTELEQALERMEHDTRGHVSLLQNELQRAQERIIELQGRIDEYQSQNPRQSEVFDRLYNVKSELKVERQRAREAEFQRDQLLTEMRASGKRSPTLATRAYSAAAYGSTLSSSGAPPSQQQPSAAVTSPGSGSLSDVYSPPHRQGGGGSSAGGRDAGAIGNVSAALGEEDLVGVDGPPDAAESLPRRTQPVPQQSPLANADDGAVFASRMPSAQPVQSLQHHRPAHDRAVQQPTPTQQRGSVTVQTQQPQPQAQSQRMQSPSVRASAPAMGGASGRRSVSPTMGNTSLGASTGSGGKRTYMSYDDYLRTIGGRRPSPAPTNASRSTRVVSTPGNGRAGAPASRSRSTGRPGSALPGTSPSGRDALFDDDDDALGPPSPPEQPPSTQSVAALFRQRTAPGESANGTPESVADQFQRVKRLVSSDL